MTETSGRPTGSGRDANLAATVDPTMESVMERVRTRWEAAEGLRVDDPFARRGMAALSEALYEASEFIEANRWKGESTRATAATPTGDLAEPLPTEPDPRLVQYVDHGEPSGRWIMLVPLALAVLALVELILGRTPW